MPICKNCGCFLKDPVELCPKCRAPFAVALDEAKRQPDPQVSGAVEGSAKPQNKRTKKETSKNTESEKSKKSPKNKEPEKPKNSPKTKRKKSKAPLVVFLSLLAILLIFGGLAYFLFMRNDNNAPKVSSFDFTCAELTKELNRALEADETTDIRLNSAKWARNDAHTAFEYAGEGFSMKAKTVKEGDISSKIKELRVGPTDTGDGVKMSALSIVTIEKNIDQDTAVKSMGEVKKQSVDKVSYDNVAFTYDRDKDEFVLVPSKGAKSVENNNSTSDEPAFPAATVVPVAGSRFIKIGDKYIFSDGSAIKTRAAITGNNTTVIEAQNDGQLLSNGERVFYVSDDGELRRLCSVKLDGTGQKELFSLVENMIPVHLYRNSIFYLRQSTDSPDDCTFCQYNIETGQTKQYDEVKVTPRRFIVDGDLMYCSAVPNADGESDTSAYCFDFAEEKYTEAIKNCTVLSHGFVNGTGKPCFDSYTGGGDEPMSNHFLYTADNGALVRSPEVKVNAKLVLASPTDGRTVLYDQAEDIYYLFDRTGGSCKTLDLPKITNGYYTFTYDLAHPEKLYATYQEGSGDLRTLKKLWQITDAGLSECRLNDAVNCDVDCIITDNCVVDAYFDAYPIEGAEKTTGASQPAQSGYEKYVGVWKDIPKEQVEHTVKITSVKGSKITFSVSSYYMMITREVTAEDIDGEIKDGRVEFTYTDSSDNTGSGVLTLGEGFVHMKITSKLDGDNVGLNFDEDMTEYSPLD